MPEQTYSTDEVLDATGVSRREVYYWCEKGYIEGQPARTGIGYRRRWTEAQAARVIEIRDAIETAACILDAAGITGHASGLRQAVRKARSALPANRSLAARLRQQNYRKGITNPAPLLSEPLEGQSA